MSYRRLASLLAASAGLAACGDNLAPIVDGTVTIDTAADVDALAGIDRIDGDLVVRARELDAIALPALVEIAGSLQVQYTTRLRGLSLPALTTIGGDLAVDDNRALAALELPIVRAGAVEILDNPALGAIALAKLDETGDLFIQDNPAAITLDLSALRSAAQVDVSLQDGLTALVLPELKLIRTGLVMDSNPALTRAELPALVTARSVHIQNNAWLEVVAAPVLTRVTDRFVAMHNPRLPTCALNELLARLIPPPRAAVMAGNDDVALCEVPAAPGQIR